MPVQPPLVVDLDGTLINTDLLVECGLAFLRRSPERIGLLPYWLAGGKARLKLRLAESVRIDVASLPYEPRVIALIQAARHEGRRVVLATASDQRLADQIAEHLGLFDAVMASDGRVNLGRSAKADALVAAYGPQGFDYVGNSAADLPVWAVARQALIVNAPEGVVREARRLANVQAVLPPKQPGWAGWSRAIRLHQWLKNLLVFVPLLTSHRYADAGLVLQAAWAFLAFGLCASSVYLLNDLLDLADDRRHASKRQRPLASGLIPALQGLGASAVLLLMAFAIAAAMLPVAFSIGLMTYYLLTLAYSLRLKRLMVVDVMVLALLYTMRIAVGGVGLGIALTSWLLAFSMFMFLSLALVKRYAELFTLQVAASGTDAAHGRGYLTGDLSMIAALGAAAGYIAVLVLALYIDDEHTRGLYRHPQLIWLACPLLLAWISRVWMLAHRGRMNQDPVVFAMRDPFSIGVVSTIGLVFWLAR